MTSRKTLFAPFAALALAASLPVLSGCTKEIQPATPVKHTPFNIQVQLTSAGIFVFPDSAPLRVGRQFPVWIVTGAPEGSCLEVKFKKEDPLEPEPPAILKKAEGPCKTVIRRGVPKAGTEGKTFAYAVTVTVPGQAPQTLDPDIEVFP